MLRRAHLRFLAIEIGALLLGVVAGCGSSTPAAPTSDFIALDSIVPAVGTVLTAGERVTFTAVVTCTIVSSNGGFTGMVVQDQGNRSLIPAGEQAPTSRLAKGTATVTLSQAVTIPESGSTVRVALPIFIDESNSTAAVVFRTYTVR